MNVGSGSHYTTTLCCDGRRRKPSHFQTKSDAASLPVYWPGPLTGAGVLRRALVLKNALGWPAWFRGSPPAPRRQPIPTEAIGKSLRVFRLGEAEHHEVAVIATQGARERRRR
jgi:hypothetical protein